VVIRFPSGIKRPCQHRERLSPPSLPRLRLIFFACVVFTLFIFLSFISFWVANDPVKVGLGILRTNADSK